MLSERPASRQTGRQAEVQTQLQTCLHNVQLSGYARGRPPEAFGFSVEHPPAAQRA